MVDYTTKHFEISNRINAKEAKLTSLRQQNTDLFNQIESLEREIEHDKNMKSALEELDPTLVSVKES